MTATPAQNTALRLKAILEVLAASGTGKLGRADVLSEVFRLVPATGNEGEIVSGTTSRGEKSLTLASGKLVKAGWLVKEGRSGWSITAAGREAFAGSPTAEAFAAALKTGNTAGTAAGAPAAALAAEVTPADVAAAAVEQDVVAAADAAAPAVAAVQNATEDLGPQPESVAVAGDFNTHMGCPADWQPEHDQAQLRLDPADGIWKLTVDLPAGSYAYKVALNRSWDENYGAFGVWDGGNIELEHAGGPVTFQYDHRTRVIATV